jgi:hypothetical protein
MRDWKSIAVFSPDKGLDTVTPSILLSESATSEMKDVAFKYGEVRRYQKRLELFESESIGDAVLAQYRFEQASFDKTWFMYFTAKDVIYRDQVNDKFVYLTPSYSEGTVSGASTISGTQFTLDFTLPTGQSLISSLKAGDYIKLGSATDPEVTDTWYRVDSVDDIDTITCDGVLPSGYSPTADDYYVRSTFSGTNNDYWCVDTFFEEVIATNNGVDYPIKWDGTTDTTEIITEEFKCKWLSSFGGRIVASNLISGGNSFPINQRWSGLADSTDWGGTGSDAGERQEINGSGYIVKTFLYRDFLYIVKSTSIQRMWAVSSADIFQSKAVRNDLGTESAHSFIIYRDVVYFFCTQDNTFRRFDGYYDSILSTGIDSLARGITSASRKIVQGAYVQSERQLCWAIPYENSTTLSHVLISDLDYKDSPWSLIEMDSTCFGTYETVDNLTWNTLPYASWDSWDWESWLEDEGGAESQLDTISDSTGGVYILNGSRQDKGVDYRSSIVFNVDMGSKRKLSTVKRFLKLQLYMRDGTGTVELAVKKDNENEWQPIDETINQEQGNDINIIEVPVDFTAKSFQLELSSYYNFGLIGMIFWYVDIGDR